jgi:hypothetical protein
MWDIYSKRGKRGERVVSRESSEAEAREPDSGIDIKSRVSSEAEAWEPDSGMDLSRVHVGNPLLLYTVMTALPSSNAK